MSEPAAVSATAARAPAGAAAPLLEVDGLNLLADIRDETGVSYVLISHDVAVVRQLTDEVLVLHRGRVVESGPTSQVLDDPQDGYTRRLRASVPRPGWKPVHAAPARPEGRLR